MVMRRRVPVLAVYFLVPVLIACSDNAQVQWNPCAVVDSLVSAGQYDRAVGVARTQYDSARLSGDRRVAVGLGARLGRLYYMNFSPDSMYYYFDDVTQDAEELEMYQECIIIHNIIGVFSLINAIEYENALHHFYAAMDYAEKSDDTDGLYWLYSEAAGNTNGNYIGSAGGTSAAGNFFFQNTEPTSSSNYYIWQITYGDDVQYIYNEGRNRWFKYSDSIKQFLTSSVGKDNTGNEEIRDITILKLIE